MHVRCEIALLLHYSRDVNCPNSSLGTKVTIIRYLHIFHNTPRFHPKILLNRCFQISWRIVQSFQNNAYAIVFLWEVEGGKQGVLREMCKWRIPNNRFILFSLNCQKIHSRGSSSFLVIFIVFYFPISKRNALAGNRTRASRVAGENSTTELRVPSEVFYISCLLFSVSINEE